jgi:hypothetical protein
MKRKIPFCDGQPQVSIIEVCCILPPLSAAAEQPAAAAQFPGPGEPHDGGWQRCSCMWHPKLAGQHAFAVGPLTISAVVAPFPFPS